MYYEVGEGEAQLCPVCGSKIRGVGPIWNAELHDTGATTGALEKIKALRTSHVKLITKFLVSAGLGQKLRVKPLGVYLDRIASDLEMQVPTIHKIMYESENCDV